jgi:cytoskeletal protein CcmA (bactofilin family)/uncharacterized membrane protein
MKRKYTFIIFTLTAMLLTSCMSASFSGDYILSEGKTLRGNLFVTSGSVTLEENSRVTGTILLTSGELRIGKNAQVGGDVVLTSGDLYLAEGSVIHGDVILASSDIKVRQSPGAKVEGNTTTNIAPYAISLLTKVFLLFCVLPIVIIIVIFLVFGVWLGRKSKKRVQTIQTPAPAGNEETPAKLQSLKKMLDDGLITESEYEAKKADLLSKM